MSVYHTRIDPPLELPLDFNHGKENNRESQDHYTDNLDRFNNQCRKLMERLLRGERLTTYNQREYGVSDLRRRIADLIAMGVPIEKEFIKDPEGQVTRFKEYYLKRPTAK
jgi:hypothetical protein